MFKWLGNLDLMMEKKKRVSIVFLSIYLLIIWYNQQIGKPYKTIKNFLTTTFNQVKIIFQIKKKKHTIISFYKDNL